MQQPALQKVLKLCAQSYDAAHFSSCLESSHVQYRLVHEEDVVYVIVRGTDECRDWCMNVHCCGASLGSYQVHAGYLRAAQGLVAQLTAHLGKSHVHLAGHSAGGCIALLAALLLAQTLPEVSFAATLVGSPCCIDRDPEEVSVTSVTNSRDAVTACPIFPCFSRPRSEVGLSFGLGFCAAHEVTSYHEAFEEFAGAPDPYGA